MGTDNQLIDCTGIKLLLALSKIIKVISRGTARLSVQDLTEMEYWLELGLKNIRSAIRAKESQANTADITQ